MRKSIWLLGSAACLAVSVFHAPLVQAKAGDDHFVILAQGVPGAPQGGPTGTGGNSGINDQGAGTDRAQTYDTPANPSNTSNSSMGDDQNRRHRHNTNTNGLNGSPSGSNGAGNGMPKSGNSY